MPNTRQHSQTTPSKSPTVLKSVKIEVKAELELDLSPLDGGMESDVSWAELVEEELNMLSGSKGTPATSTPAASKQKAKEKTKTTGGRAKGKLKYDAEATEAIAEKVSLGDRLDNVSNGAMKPPRQTHRLSEKEYPILRRSPRKKPESSSRRNERSSPKKTSFSPMDLKVEFNDGRSRRQVQGMHQDATKERAQNSPRGSGSRGTNQAHGRGGRHHAYHENNRQSPRKRHHGSTTSLSSDSPHTPGGSRHRGGCHKGDYRSPAPASENRKPSFKRPRRDSYDPNRSYGRLSDASTSSGNTSHLSPAPHRVYEDWVDPTLGWEHDKTVLDRRQKDLEKGYNSNIYKEYIKKVPREKRQGGQPRTPNKFIKFPRRSWDMQVRIWRKLIYYWNLPAVVNNESMAKMTPSTKLQFLKSKVPPHAQNADDSLLDSLLGNSSLDLSGIVDFDEDTKTQTLPQAMNDEESTLTGAVRGAVGALDFSNLTDRQ